MEMLENFEDAQEWHDRENDCVEITPLGPNSSPSPLIPPPLPPPKDPYPQISSHPLEPSSPIALNPPNHIRPLCEHVTRYQVHNPIRLPHIDVPNFSIKSHMFGLVESRALFHGNPHDDPHLHLYNLDEICNTGLQNSTCQEFTRLALFPFSLKGQAKEWFMSLPHHHLKSWDDIQTEFLKQYFPIGRYLHLKVRVATFKQDLNESLDNAWVRFKKILRACPNHGYSLETQIQFFCNGLYESSRKQVESTCHESFWMSTAQEAHTAIESETSNERLWDSGPKEKEVSIGYEHNLNEREIKMKCKRVDESQVGKKKLKHQARANVPLDVLHVDDFPHSNVPTQEEMGLFGQHWNLENSHTHSIEPPLLSQKASSQLEQDLVHTKRLLEKLTEVVGAQVANIKPILDSIVTMSQEIGNLKASNEELNTRVGFLEASIRNFEDHIPREGRCTRTPGGLPNNTGENPSVNSSTTRSEQVCGDMCYKDPIVQNTGNDEVDDDLNGMCYEDSQDAQEMEDEINEEEETIIFDSLSRDRHVNADSDDEEGMEKARIWRNLKKPRLINARTLFEGSYHDDGEGNERSKEKPQRSNERVRKNSWDWCYPSALHWRPILKNKPDVEHKDDPPPMH